MARLHAGELSQSLQLTPGRETLHCVQVGLARVIVCEMRREKLNEAFLSLLVGDKENRQVRTWVNKSRKVRS
jgi:hypothetical protein